MHDHREWRPPSLIICRACEAESGVLAFAALKNGAAGSTRISPCRYQTASTRWNYDKVLFPPAASAVSHGMMLQGPPFTVAPSRSSGPKTRSAHAAASPGPIAPGSPVFTSACYRAYLTPQVPILTACANCQTKQAETRGGYEASKRKNQNRVLYRKRGDEFLSATLTVSFHETQRFAHYPGHTKQPQ
jgi:hypothetical protein